MHIDIIDFPRDFRDGFLSRRKTLDILGSHKSADFGVYRSKARRREKVMNRIEIIADDYKLTLIFGVRNDKVIDDVKNMLIDSFNERIESEKNNGKKS